MTAPVHATKFKMVEVQANALESCVSLCKGIKEIGKIFGSKLEHRLLDPFFELVQNTTLVRFRTCFASAISVRPRGTCESSTEVPEDSQPGVEGVLFMYTTSDRFNTWLILT